MVNAFVMVIWGKTPYLVGALTTAQSLKDVGTKNEIVLLYAQINGINKYLDECKKVFDRIIQIDLYNNYSVIDPLLERQKKYYKGYFFNTVLTRWACLELEEYDKICNIDSDTVFIRNPDSVFECNTPAAVFKTPFMVPYAKNGYPNPYINIGHNKIVNRKIIENAFKTSSVANGFMVLLKPDKKVFNKIKNIMKKERPYGHKKCISGADEQIITDVYFRDKIDWYNIEPYYMMVPWKIKNFYNNMHMNKSISLHYFLDKPWEEGESAKYIDTAYWWRVFYHITDDVISNECSTWLKSLIPKRILEQSHKILSDAHKQHLFDINIKDVISYPPTYTKVGGGNQTTSYSILLLIPLLFIIIFVLYNNTNNKSNFSGVELQTTQQPLTNSPAPDYTISNSPLNPISDNVNNNIPWGMGNALLSNLSTPNSVLNP